MPNPREAHERRGAAFTFNAPVFISCLQRLRDDSLTAHPIPFPSFDHARGDPVQDDVWVMPKHRLVLVEVHPEPLFFVVLLLSPKQWLPTSACCIRLPAGIPWVCKKVPCWDFASLQRGLHHTYSPALLRQWLCREYHMVML
jgi:hypothetical protein